MRARLAALLRRRREPPARPARPELDAAAREARIAAAHARGWARRLSERAARDAARSAIVAALLATERAAVRHAAGAPSRRSGGGPPLLH